MTTSKGLRLFPDGKDAPRPTLTFDLAEYRNVSLFALYSWTSVKHSLSAVMARRAPQRTGKLVSRLTAKQDL